MSHVLQSDDLLTYLLLSKLFAGNMLVLAVIRTVHAAVNAVVGKVQRRKHNDTVSVKILFYLTRQLVDLLVSIRKSAVQKHRSLTVGKTPALFCFCNNAVDKLGVVLVFFGVIESFQYLGIVNKFFRFK